MPLKISDRYICYPPPPAITNEKIKEKKRQELENREAFFCDPHHLGGKFFAPMLNLSSGMTHRQRVLERKALSQQSQKNSSSRNRLFVNVPELHGENTFWWNSAPDYSSMNCATGKYSRRYFDKWTQYSALIGAHTIDHDKVGMMLTD